MAISGERATSYTHNSLKPDGKIFIYVPAFPLLYSSIDKYVGHYRRYKKRSLANMIEKIGFEIISAEYIDSLGFFCWLLQKWFKLENEGNVDLRVTKLFDRFIFPVSRKLDYIFKLFFGKNLLVIAKK